MTQNSELIERRKAAIPNGLVSVAPVFISKAENAELWDVEGTRYIDFAAGIAACNTGHRHPKVMAAVAEQCKAFTHTAFQVAPYENYITLAERLNAIAPIDNAKTIFMTTGTEAVENAIKIARHASQRSAIISFVGAFHGRSLLAMGLTGKVMPYKAGFGPLPADIYHVPFPIEHYGLSEQDCIASLNRLFASTVEPSRVAAIIIEPVQGEGGFYITPKGFMKQLREICNSHGILLICDEVQTGFARTGKIFAIEHYDIKPDIITVAKSLAGGLPLSGVIGRGEIMDSPQAGSLGGTYGGSPIGCAAAHAVLDIIKEEKLCERSEKMGQRMIERINVIKDRNDTPAIGDVRGLGAMVAFELVKTRGGHEPDPKMTKALLAAALEKGLILLSCGIYGNTIRLLSPLTVSDEVLEEGLDILEQSMIKLGG